MKRRFGGRNRHQPLVSNQSNGGFGATQNLGEPWRIRRLSGADLLTVDCYQGLPSTDFPLFAGFLLGRRQRSRAAKREGNCGRNFHALALRTLGPDLWSSFPVRQRSAFVRVRHKSPHVPIVSTPSEGCFSRSSILPPGAIRFPSRFTGQNRDLKRDFPQSSVVPLADRQYFPRGKSASANSTFIPSAGR